MKSCTETGLEVLFTNTLCKDEDSRGMNEFLMTFSCLAIWKWFGFFVWPFDWRIWSEDGTNRLRDYFLFGPQKLTHAFLGFEKLFLPYLALTSSFVPYLTPPYILLANSVKSYLKRQFCPSCINEREGLLLHMQWYLVPRFLSKFKLLHIHDKY
jgi:hypothetical protein